MTEYLKIPIFNDFSIYFIDLDVTAREQIFKILTFKIAYNTK